MAVNEAQVPLPAPPTGAAIVFTEHVYNPENGHYEPSIRGVPLSRAGSGELVGSRAGAVVRKVSVLSVSRVSPFVPV